jgi:hypothetical protein
MRPLFSATFSKHVQPMDVGRLPIRQNECDQDMVGVVGELVQKGCPPPVEGGEVFEAASIRVHLEEMVRLVSPGIFSKQQHVAGLPELPGEVGIVECRDEPGDAARNPLNLQVHSALERSEAGNRKPVRGELKAVPVGFSKEVFDGDDAGRRIARPHGKRRGQRHERQ